MPNIHVHVHGTRTTDSGTSEGAKKAAITRKQHSGGGAASHVYPHSKATHEHHANRLEEQAANFRGRGQHGTAAQFQHVAEMHRKAAGMRLNTPGGRKFSERVHATARRNRMDSADGSVEETVREFKEGTLHSGSKTGPEVKSRKQAVAIALSQAGKSSRDKSTRDFLPG